MSGTTVRLPERDLVLVGDATILSVDPDVGEVGRSDIEIRDGTNVAVGRRLEAPGAEIVDGTARIDIPAPWTPTGVLEERSCAASWVTVRSMAGSRARARSARGSRGRRGGRDAYRPAEGLTTVHDWADNVLSPMTQTRTSR